MARLINIGYGNVVNSDKIVTVISPESAPIKRLVQNAKANGTAVDATQGRKTRAVVITDSGHVIMSALMPDRIADRIESLDRLIGQSKEREESQDE